MSAVKIMVRIFVEKYLKLMNGKGVRIETREREKRE